MPKTSPLTVAELVGLPCPYCGRRVPKDTAWLAAAQARWGSCGVKLSHEGTAIAVLAFAPCDKADEAMLKVVWVRPESAGRGYGRQLVQAAAAEMVRRKLAVLLAAGARTNLNCAAPPVKFLREVGFTRRVDERHWRLELHQAVPERTGLGVVARLLRGFGAGPEPAGGAISPRAHRSVA